MNSPGQKSKHLKAVFLDRDGVINVDTGYVSRPIDLVWMKGSGAAIRLLNQRGYDVFIVTNQSGIARGFYSEEEFLNLARWMEAKLASQGAEITQTLYCPHHPTEGAGLYTIDCDCRKPKPGLIFSGLASGGYDAARCFLIGDRESDLQAAEAAGIRGYLFEGGDLLQFVERIIGLEQQVEKGESR